VRDDRQRLLDILEAIDRIQRRAGTARDAFYADELMQVRVIHRVQIIGEAAARISEALRGAHAEVPWAAITAMRNVLVHDYFGIDKDEVWTTVTRDLPELKRKVEAILADPGTGPPGSR
jgi:uncharacterized protein with HEPN domain